MSGMMPYLWRLPGWGLRIGCEQRQPQGSQLNSVSLRLEKETAYRARATLRFANSQSRQECVNADGCDTTVLIADDHPTIRKGLQTLINKTHDCCVVAEVFRGEDLLSSYVEYSPSIVLLDLHMPGMGGEAALGMLLREAPSARVIILSHLDAPDVIRRCLAAGAKGYIGKNQARHEIVDAIRNVQSGRRALGKHIAERLAETFHFSPLSAREMDVIRYIAAGRSNKEIARSLGIKVPTVKVHVTHILQKLQARDRTHAVVTALRWGIISLNPEH